MKFPVFGIGNFRRPCGKAGKNIDAILCSDDFSADACDIRSGSFVNIAKLDLWPIEKSGEYNAAGYPNHCWGAVSYGLITIRIPCFILILVVCG